MVTTFATPLIKKAVPLARTVTGKGITTYFDDIVNFFKKAAKIPKVSAGTKAAVTILGTTAFSTVNLALLTQTPGGQQFTTDVVQPTVQTGKGFVEFLQTNPLLIAGGLILIGLIAVKK